MKKIITTIFLVIMVTLTIAQPASVNRKNLKKLAGAMAGEFNNNQQADQDKSYYHIVLRMKPIWKDNPDGYWFYVEQAVTSSEDKPYRQRVYHLYIQDDTTIVSKVYELKDPTQYVGAWKDAQKLAGLTADSLVDRQGCAVYLHRGEKGVFKGSTPGKECLSSLRGASYATSEVTIYADRIISWDRGWNAEDQQVWGAEEGGYIFVKVKDLK
jgi:CpeT protein